MIIVKILVLVACYLIGSISPAIILCKLRYNVDIRTLGSGNAGTTNVLRNFGKKMAGLTLLLDALKGAICYLAGSLVLGSYEMGLLCGLAAILGHVFPVYYGFKGGKGVATTLGLVIFAAPKAGLVALIIALALMAVSKRISVGSLLGILVFVVAVGLFKYGTVAVIWALALMVIIWIKHRANIKRILSGTEPEFSLKK